MTRRIVLMIDLANDPAALAEYENAHATGNVPAAVLASQRQRGIAAMDIYRTGERLAMVMEVGEDYDPAGLESDARTDPAIAAWHRQMGTLQRPFGGASSWAEATRVFSQNEQP